MMLNPLSDFSSRTSSGEEEEEGAAGGLMDSAGEDFPHLRSSYNPPLIEFYRW